MQITGSPKTDPTNVQEVEVSDNAAHVKVTGSKVKRAFDVTPNDGADLAHNTTGLMVATDGNVKVTLVDDTNPIVLPGLAAGTIYPIEAKRVWATSTTATGVVAIW